MNTRTLIGGAAFCAALSLAVSGSARAEVKVFTPDVNRGELSVETTGDAGFDRDRATKVLFQGRLVEKSEPTFEQWQKLRSR